MKSELYFKLLNGLVTGLILFSTVANPAAITALQINTGEMKRNPLKSQGATSSIDDLSASLSRDDWAQIKVLMSASATSQQAYLKASNTAVDDGFGRVSLFGDTLVVGAPGEDSNATGVNGSQTNNSTLSSGAVYVFIRSGTTWSQQAYLKASNTGFNDNFGSAVSLSGDTLVVGAHNEFSNATGVNGNGADNSASRSGAAYVFTRSGTTWSPQAYLKASNTGADDYFGHAVSLSGDTLVVGAYNEDSNATGVDGDQTNNLSINSGAAYVFTRSGTTWSPQAYLKASNTEANDNFGYDVSLFGDTLVVGALGEDSNATGLNGSQTNNSAGDSGAAYVFTRSGTTWSSQAYLKASNTEANDNFGHAVSLSGNTLVVGAWYEDSNTLGVNGNQTNNLSINSGAAYVFTRSGTTWSSQAYLKASNTGANDGFGYEVSLSGDTLVVGAYNEDSNATGVDGDQANNSAGDSGAAYVFTRSGTTWSGTTWSQKTYLKASNTGANDYFGYEVSLSADTLVVGALREASNATGVNGNQIDNSASVSGAAYVFSLKTLSGPFLDLPLPSTNFSVTANGNFGGENPGRVNSWFDHSVPDYSENNNLTKWDGKYFDFLQQATQQGLSWYDGHNGIDFSHDRSQPNEPIYTAANGTVFGVVNNCGGCKTGYGNRVWINHGNGYATLYGHLATVSVANGAVITNRLAQPLGVMGNTGNSKGIHLHFGLYYDQNDDKVWTESEVVDPYGWQGISSDPWSVPSTYLWIHPLVTEQQAGNAGGSVTSPSGLRTVTIPSGALDSFVTLEMWDMPPVAEPSAQLRSSGNSFLMKVLEWLTGSGGSSALSSLSTPGFNTPVTVTVNFDPSAMSHIDINQLVIQQWDETGQVWTPLTTTIDTINNQASAETSQPGNFDLQGPLVCSADTLEPNDNYDGSIVIQTNGSSLNNLFDIAQDEDWFQFDAITGKSYALKTINLSAGVDTVLEIYDADGVTLLSSDDNSGGGKASSLNWSAPSDGVYFVRVRKVVGSTYGCSANYGIVVDAIPVVSSITRVNANPTNAATVSFTVTFSEAVTGVDASDFALTTMGVTNATITNVTGSGTTRMVTVNTGTGNGTIRLGLVDNNTIIDNNSNPLGGANAGDGNFTTGEVYTIIKSAAFANVQVTIAGNSVSNYSIPSEQSISNDYGINGGPVLVSSTNGLPIFTSQRAIFGSSFNSIVGYPADQLITDYWFTSYDDLGMITYLVIGNPHPTLTAQVDVYIGGVKKNATSYSIPPGQRIFPRYGVNAGPVRVVSTNGVNIFTSERTKFGNSFNEVMGYPANQLTTDYWFTSYDDVGMITYLVIGNPHATLTAEVDVYINGVKKNATPYSIAPGQRIFPRYATNAGPVRVVSTNGVNIFTSERSKFGNSFNEVMGYPADQLTTDYWFTSYDDVGMITYLVIGNPHPTLTAEVDVYLAGVKKNATPYIIAPGQRVFPRYAINQGPVHVVSTNGVEVFTSERAKYLSSFNEIMGLPANQLTTDYWFTSYDDVGMDTELVIAAP